MSNNAPDYEDNLVFPPQEIKSQHELSEQGRQSDVLIKAIEKCEKLEKEIIALKKEYKAECNRADELEDSLQTSWRNESKLKKQLEISVKECQQLKELLKEWAQFEIEENPNDFTVISERMSGLANKTKQAIGE